MMKQFEKQFPEPKSISGMVNDDPWNWWKEKQEGWRAALKWVLEDTEYTGDHGESIIDQNIIRKELGDKTYD